MKHSNNHNGDHSHSMTQQAPSPAVRRDEFEPLLDSERRLRS
jgi:hypothetical protein